MEQEIPRGPPLDVGEVVVELPQVVVPLILYSREDAAAAGQLGEILGGEKGKLSAGKAGDRFCEE